MAANGRTGPVASVSPEFHCSDCPVMSDWSLGGGSICGMKCGICESILQTYLSLVRSTVNPAARSSVANSVCQLPEIGLYKTPDRSEGNSISSA
jgi:hypothetical protein